MSKSVNKVILVGNLGSSPEQKFTASGKAVVKFNMATSSSIKDASGEWVEKTEWHSITLWERLAELAAQYLTKGSKVYIEGRLQTNSWDDKQTGEKKYRTEIVASDLIFLDNKGDSKSTGNTVAASQEITDEGEDIPF